MGVGVFSSIFSIDHCFFLLIFRIKAAFTLLAAETTHSDETQFTKGANLLQLETLCRLDFCLLILRSSLCVWSADFHRCNKALSEREQDTAPCVWYQRVYKSLCPMGWVRSPPGGAVTPGEPGITLTPDLLFLFFGCTLLLFFHQSICWNCLKNLTKIDFIKVYFCRLKLNA